jgi:N6-L-threonylcarbamoyladenine synthase
MIAWTGVVAYNSGITTPIGESHIDPRWRLDKVEVPWRS